MKKHIVSTLFGLVLLNGCYYTTAPRQWSQVKKTVEIQRTEHVQNGSRVGIYVEEDGGGLIARTVQVPFCREVSFGYTVTHLEGKEEAHTWPSTLIGLGMMATSGLILSSSVEEDTEDGKHDEADIAWTTGGAVLGVTGLIMFIAGVGGSDEDIAETRMRQERQPYRDWTSEEGAERCTSTHEIKPLPDVLFDMSVRFPHAERGLSFVLATDESGSVRIPDASLSLIRQVARYCGRAEVKLKSRDADFGSGQDTPENPSQEIGGSLVTQMYMNPAEEGIDPESMEDPEGKRLALYCSQKTTSACFAPHEGKIQKECLRKCNDQAGAVYCSAQYEVDASLPGFTSEEEEKADERYADCVRQQGIGAADTQVCQNACVQQQKELLCPRGW